MGGEAGELEALTLVAGELEVLRAQVPALQAALAEEVAAVARARAELSALEKALEAREASAARKGEEVARVKDQLAVLRRLHLEAAQQDPAWRDWGNALGRGLPAEVLAKVAEEVVVHSDAAWSAVWLKRMDHDYWDSEALQRHIALSGLGGGDPGAVRRRRGAGAGPDGNFTS